MNDLKQQFIELAISHRVLTFGHFQLKSGRFSPYFFNAGLFYTGSALKKLGECYAEVLLQQQVEFSQLFGPAYKGLPLATATAIALANHGKDIEVSFNRKEKKEHGEGGQLIGAPLTGKTVIIDDVMTAGTAFREAKQLIEAQGAKVSAVIIALDRRERGESNDSAVNEVKNMGIEVYSIINFFDLVAYLKQNDNHKQLELMLSYHDQYGVK